MSIYDDAALVMIPSGYKASKLYSVVPDDGDGDFTVTRAGDTATRINSDLEIEGVDANIPRLNYFTASGCPVLLIEPQATNLFLNSAIGVTQNITVTNATQYTIYFLGGTGSITLSNAATGTVNVSDFTRNNKVTFTTASTTLTCTIAGDVQMVQVELGTGTSYIPTTGSSETRSADAVTRKDITSTTGSILWNSFVQNYTLIASTSVFLDNNTSKFVLFNRNLTPTEISGLGATEATWISALSGIRAISLTVSGTGTVYWGDGESSVYNGTDVVLTHTFSTVNEPISFVGTLTKIYNATASSKLNHSIASLPVGLTYYVNTGSNTTSGDIASLPVGLTSYDNAGSNTTSGDIASLPVGLTSYYNTGNNTTSGDIASLPVGLTYYYNAGSNQVDTYTAGRTWSNNMSRVYHAPASGYGLSSTEVDNLLIDLASVATWTGSKEVYLAGNNAARTAASDAAVIILQGKGVTVTTN